MVPMRRLDSSAAAKDRQGIGRAADQAQSGDFGSVSTPLFADRSQHLSLRIGLSSTCDLSLPIARRG
jgi:hypothetical protein